MTILPATSTRTQSAATILFVHSGSDWIRGSEQCLLDLVTHLDRNRFRPVVICNREVVADAVVALGAVAEVLPDLEGSRVIAARSTVAHLRKVAVRWQARLIHANSSIIFPSVVPVARSLRIPALAHLHITPTKATRRHELLHQASLVVGVSELAVEGFVEEGMQAEKVKVIFNAVDGERLSAGDATGLRAQLGIPSAACVAVTLGSLIHRKGHDTAIRGVGIARSNGAGVHLLICGSGDEREALERLAKQEGVSQFVHFLGFRADAGALLRDAADVCIASSRWEALPLNVLEAQWLGIPVIASDIPAHREALVDTISSRVVALDDAAALADALISFIGDGERTNLARDVTRPVARERFSMGRYVSEFAASYERLMELPARRNGWVLGSSWPHDYTNWATEIIRRRLRVLSGAR